jgi:hypothetical protein
VGYANNLSKTKPGANSRQLAALYAAGSVDVEGQRVVTSRLKVQLAMSWSNPVVGDAFSPIKQPSSQECASQEMHQVSLHGAEKEQISGGGAATRTSPGANVDSYPWLVAPRDTSYEAISRSKAGIGEAEDTEQIACETEKAASKGGRGQ